jgi:Xaa-Pro aminopeptidase
VLFHSPIERDGAVKAGLSLRSYAEFSFEQLFEEARGDVSLAEALRYKKMFESLELTRGRVAVYGIIDLGIAYNHLSKLKKFFPEIDFDISPEQDVISKARVTKDTQELSRIKRMGVLTTQIVGNIADYLTSHRVKNEVLLLNDDTPLTISDVKRKIRYLLIENNIQANETIFAIGRDAGVPHNNGNPASIIKLGETIIFDAFFQEIGGGYFYDFTRTWCLGYAPDEVQKVHHDVKEVYDQIV